MFITTIKNVTEEKKSSEAELYFIVPIKLTTTTKVDKKKKNMGQEMGKKK